MVHNKETRAPLPRSACCAILLVALVSGACSRFTSSGSDRSQVSNATNTSANNSAVAVDNTNTSMSNPAEYDAEISRLEKQAEKSPADDTVNVSLSQVYVRRAEAYRQRGQLREAGRDYQEALRRDPDNEAAQQGNADISQQVESQATGENGEPAPLPITPDAASSGDEELSPKTEPSPQRKRP
ncbi:MAG: tetratricopeptide repeat protein [Acidobacteriota bacterium]|nr:tetratricopeptide repeat protein [Acidobacteriota bacterium]